MYGIGMQRQRPPVIWYYTQFNSSIFLLRDNTRDPSRLYNPCGCNELSKRTKNRGTLAKIGSVDHDYVTSNNWVAFWFHIELTTTLFGTEAPGTVEHLHRIPEGRMIWAST